MCHCAGLVFCPDAGRTGRLPVLIVAQSWKVAGTDQRLYNIQCARIETLQLNLNKNIIKIYNDLVEILYKCLWQQNRDDFIDA